MAEINIKYLNELAENDPNKMISDSEFPFSGRKLTSLIPGSHFSLYWSLPLIWGGAA